MQFDQVYVVSDLHFGGSARKIFAGEREFPKFIDAVTDAAQARSTALVINGDFIDFLAIDKPSPPTYFDVDNARDKLIQTMNDPVFKPSFAALGRFANAAKARLIVNLGNHDLELCLPEVQLAFAESIGTDLRNVLWIDDGSGVRLRVGHSEVLCLHGNEVDESNDVDFEMLRYIKLCRNAGVYRSKGLEQWIPNAGTQLVINAMNTVKQKHAFVDLLKPETSALPPVLLSIDGSEALRAAIPAAWALVSGHARTWMSKNIERGRLVLSASGDDSNGAVIPAIDDTEEDLFKEIEQAQSRGLSAMQMLANRDLGPQTLGGTFDWLKFFAAKLRGKDATEQLHNALSELARDQSFALTHQDCMNTALQNKIADSVHFLCSGHTHFRRSLRMGATRHHYNSGTWAYLMRLDEKLLANPERFREFHNVLKQGPDVSQLAETGYAFKALTAIHIEALPDQRVRGCLRECVIAQQTFSMAMVAESERIITL